MERAKGHVPLFPVGIGFLGVPRGPAQWDRGAHWRSRRLTSALLSGPPSAGCLRQPSSQATIDLVSLEVALHLFPPLAMVPNLLISSFLVM